MKLQKRILLSDFLDFVQVKGKNIPVKVYELVADKSTIKSETVDLIKVFEKGLDHYFKQQWDDAIIQFKESENLEDYFTSRNTTPSKIYIERCNMFINNPPGEEWDGVWKMTAK